MPDDRDDVPEEPPTRPDLVRVRCPRCRGTGKVLGVKESATSYSGTEVPCATCAGEGKLDRKALAAYHAETQGRPRR